jgi:hypothetical protein
MYWQEVSGNANGYRIAKSISYFPFFFSLMSFSSPLLLILIHNLLLFVSLLYCNLTSQCCVLRILRLILLNWATAAICLKLRLTQPEYRGKWVSSSLWKWSRHLTGFIWVRHVIRWSVSSTNGRVDWRRLFVLTFEETLRDDCVISFLIGDDDETQKITNWGTLSRKSDNKSSPWLT